MSSILTSLFNRKAKHAPAPEKPVLPLFGLADDFAAGFLTPEETLKEMKRTLAAGADVNARGDKQETVLLTVTTKRGAAELVKTLIAAGADPNLTMADGMSPLLNAAKVADAETMKVLYDNGADGKAIRHEPPRAGGGDWSIGGGERDVFYCVIVHNLNEDEALQPARRECLKLAMERTGLPCSEISFVYTSKPYLREVFPGMEDTRALEKAVEAGNPAWVKELLAKGVHPDDAATKFDNDTALDAAIQKGNLEIVKLLLDAGADINLLGPSGNLTPLQRAAWSQQKDVFGHLLAQGADPEKLGRGTGSTILSVAGDENGEMAVYIKDVLARRTVETLRPIGVSKPLKLKAR